ncbi:unnamed protein product [Periconia digitata]|uniref:6-methylsalicylate decarboxylase n=1 Tax=Periconia digitata TaxID=1303443 RepID=A0A9W4XG97_9PLEO|nr:unnamed protein product [Periconia digitata]
MMSFILPLLTLYGLLTALEETGGDPSGWKLPFWSVTASKSFMQAHGIRTSILSVTAPGCCILQGASAAALARAMNEEGAAIRKGDPESFGFFAAVPPIEENADAAVAEIEYALDILGAEGVTLYTRYGTGARYLGHEVLRPVWVALNARKAVVFVHPTHSPDTELVSPLLPQPIIDYPHETTRAAVDMISAGVVRDFPNVKIILSHAGGSLPFLATRAAHLLADTGLSGQSAGDLLADARRFYFDTALSGSELSLPMVLDFAAPGHVLFGSDFPYAPTATIETNMVTGVKVLAERGDNKGADLAANTARILPQLMSR